MSNPRVIIIGAGITGLLLAEALKARNIAFDIYERDPDADSRRQGWGLAIHWALDTLRNLLPQDLRERLPETYVDPELGEGIGRFPLFRLSDGKILHENLSDKRVRVSRERLRGLLMSDLQIKWGKKVESVAKSEDGSIRVQFSDKSLAEGTFLAGCDGTRSKVREILCGLNQTDPDNKVLPVRFLGASVDLSYNIISRLRKLDPLFFQASHPNDSFMFFGIQDTRHDNKRSKELDTCRGQVIVSWPYRKGFLGENDPIAIPQTEQEKLSLMRKIADTWTGPFRDAVHSIQEDTSLLAINLEDYLPSRGFWDNLGGRATLLGDAAHAMTMYRGEAANHAFKDVEELVERMVEHTLDIPTVCFSYENSMIDRTRRAVLASRQACLDAHEHSRIDHRSPLISKRAIVPGDVDYVDSPVL